MLLGPVAIALAIAAPASSQATGTRPRIFLDCNAPNCNGNYFRTEINWVNWVNDRAVADVHVIVGSLQTGAGGREYQLDFIGVSTVDGYEQQLRYEQLPTDTERESLDGLTHTLGLGIAAWANSHGYRGLVSLEGHDPELGNGALQRRLVSQEEVDDPWNLWVFRINGNLNRNSEETNKNTQINAGFNASRVTPTWKLSTNSFMNYRRIYRKLSSGVFRDYPIDWRVGQLVAYSIAEHWSVGSTFSFARQTQNNRDLQVMVSPAIEYSFFPYDEATRRSLTVFYSIGPQYNNYMEPTIYDRLHETRFEHSVDIRFDQRQPWGDAGISIRASHYLHDFDLYNRSVQGSVNYRITRGVSIFANGDISWLQDQIYLSAENVTDEEALLNLRRQATDTQYGFSFGVTFQFGSIFNNVVNNRFTNIQGFGGPGGGGGGGGRGGGFN
ncbi:MAG: hypothetical protein AB7T31_05320 [Gemmatimonadales bacterium]